MRIGNSFIVLFFLGVVLFGANGPASAQLWTLQNGNDVVKIEDRLVTNTKLGTNESLGMSYWTMNGSVDRLYQQWFWYSVGPNTAPTSLAVLPVTSSIPYTTSPITTPLQLTFTDPAIPQKFSIIVNYTLAGSTTTGGTPTVTKRVTIKNLTATPLEFHFYHYSDFDIRYVPGTRTTAQIDYDAGAVRGGKAYQTSFTDTVPDGITLVQTTSLPASRIAVDSNAANAGDLDNVANSLPMDNELYPGHFDLADSFTGPYVEYDGSISPRDTQLGMQWDLSIAANGETTFDIIDEVLPSKPVVITGSSYNGTCTTPTQAVTYNICFSNQSNPSLALTNAVVEYHLGKTTFVSASDSGTYDAEAKKVTWKLGGIAANAPERCLSVVGVSSHSLDMVQKTEMWSDQTFPASRDEVVHACNHPPRIDATAIPKYAEEGKLYTFQIAASDEDPGTVLQYFIQSGPAGMAVSPTGIVTWTPGRAQGQSVDVTVRVSDGIASTTETFTITVVLQDLPPKVEAVVAQTATETIQFRYQIIATDPEGGSLRYTPESVPIGLKVDLNTGVVTWTPTAGSAGTYGVKINVSDAMANMTTLIFDVTVIPASVNHPPQFTSTPVYEVKENMPYLYLAVATDPDEGDSVGYSLINPPMGMRIVSQTGEIYWTPEYTQAGKYPMTVVATDIHKGVAIQEFEITVINVDRPPVFSSVPVTAVKVNDSYVYRAVASDPDNKAIIKYALTTAPAGMSIDAAAGVVTWKPAAAGVVTVVVTAQDEEGGVGQQEFQLNVYDPTIQNLPPVVTSVPPVASVKEGEGYLYKVEASDPNDDLLTYTLAPGAPIGVILNKTTGLLTWLTTYKDIGVWTVSVIVIDGRGGSVTHKVTITVDNVPPIFMSAPLLVGNDASVYYYSATAIDVDEAPVTLSLFTYPAGMTINSQGVIAWPKPVVGKHEVVVRASDGRSTTDQRFTLTITHLNQAPVLYSGAPLTAINEGTIYKYDVNAQDPNNDVLTYTLDPGKPAEMTINSTTGEIVWPTNYTSVGTTPITVRISDGSLETTESFNVVVMDLGPVFKSSFVATGEVGKPYSYTALAQDPGNAPITYKLASGPSGMTINQTSGVVSWTTPVEGSYAVSISASDGRGSSVQSYTLKIVGTNVKPVIASTAPTTSINEGSQYTYDVEATDSNGDSLIYKLAAGAPAAMTINSSTGVISWTPMAAHIGATTVTVNVDDGRGGIASQTVTVNVSNVSPVFTSTPIIKWTPSSAYSYTATAADPGGASVTYSKGAGFPAQITLNPTTGAVSWTTPVLGTYTIIINATDGRATTPQEYTLTVEPVGNNLPPVFTTTIPSLSLNEGDSFSYDVNASDGNGDPITYSLVPGYPSGMIISSSTGIISWTPGYNQANSYKVTVRATDTGGLYVEQAFTLTVNDIDRAPTISSKPGTSANEAFEYKYVVTATDPDGDALTYSLTKAPAGMTISSMGVITWTPTVYQGGTHAVTLVVKGASLAAIQEFTVKVALLSSHTPTITSKAPTTATAGLKYGYQVVVFDPDPATVLKFELLQPPAGMVINATSGLLTWDSPVAGSYSITIKVTDNTTLVDTETYTLVVTPGSNVQPVISSSPVTTAIAGQPYRYEVVATDANGNLLSYTLAGAPAGMAISSVGVISWTPPAPGQHPIKVAVSDGSLTAEQAYILTVGSPANNPPVITSSATGLEVTTAKVGVPYSYQVTASDPEGATIVYSLLSYPTGMTISSQGLITWTPSQVGAPTVIVSASDGSQSTTQAYTITVSAAVNSPPKITSTPVTSATEGKPYSYAVIATDADTGDVLSYHLNAAPTGMAIGASTGVISWTPNYYQSGEHSVTVRVQDKAGMYFDQTYIILVANAEGPPEITSKAPTVATVGVQYQYQVTAKDPDVGDVVTISLSVRPTGMTINTFTGLISWTPDSTQAGQHNVTVVAKDTAGASVEQSYVITVTGADLPPTVSSVATTTATVNVPYTYQVIASDPNGDQLTYAVTTNATGMAISPTGFVTWTPATAGTYDVTVTVTAGGKSAMQPYILTVTGPTNTGPTIDSVPVTVATEGTPYSYTVTATDPDAGDAVTFTLIVNPTNMTINGATGVISWTPDYNQAGTKDVTVRATDRAGASFDQQFTITVMNEDRPPVITSTAPTTGTINTVYRYALAASDPDGDAVIYSLVSGPSGMIIDGTTGVITWTPAVSGTFPVSVKAAANGLSALQDFIIDVAAANQAPYFTSTPVKTAVVNVGYSYQAVAVDPEGGTVAYSFSGKIPRGMSINSTTGVLTWKPTATGTYSVNIKASDGVLSATQSFSIVVGNTPVSSGPTITSKAVTTATVGKLYTYQVVATDPDTNQLTYSLTALPAGMTISATGLISWTPSTIGTPTVTVSVSDGTSAAAETFTLTVITNQLPEITSIAPTVVTVGTPYSYQVVATDANGDPLSYSLPTAPTGMAISATGLVSWTPSAAQAGDQPVIISVSDGTGSVEQRFSVSVRGNSAPVITTTSLPNATARVRYSRTVTATDADGDRLVFSLATAPAGMTISTSGTISWTPSTTQRGTHTVTVAVSDGLATTTKSYSVTVN